MIDKCCKCGKHKETNNHHVLPQVFFGSKTQTIVLCLDCHKEIELIYLIAEGSKGKRKPLDSIKYYVIFTNWLTGKYNEIRKRTNQRQTFMGTGNFKKDRRKSKRKNS